MVPTDKQKSKLPDLTVVCIGASAGGLSALEELLTGFDPSEKLNMAFVIVQHLDPTHKSMLSEIISNYTSMEVCIVTNGIYLIPNCIYIIPPNAKMEYSNGTLQLSDLDGLSPKILVIDYFLESLAKEKQDKAIAVILSGTGNDGTLGIKKIKHYGGVAFVQEPDTAKFDGMPLSAISTGLIDYILSPLEIAETIFNGSYLKTTSYEKKEYSSFDNEVQQDHEIFSILQEQTGHDFSNYKNNTIKRRIFRRMAIHNIETKLEYLTLLKTTRNEVDLLFKDLLIGVTNFFRDDDAFLFIEKSIIPALFENKPEGSTIRVWSAGCSTGEEPYSLAILILEYLKENKLDYKIQIFASDIDEDAIKIARRGHYPPVIEAHISKTRLSEYFVFDSNTGLYKVSNQVRDLIIFSEHDLIKNPPFSNIDFLCCRNLLIYFSNHLQKKIIPLFHYSLRLDGILFLGISETISGFENQFIVMNNTFKVFRRINNSLNMRGKYMNKLMENSSANTLNKKPTEYHMKSLTNQSLRDIVEKSIVKETSIAGILTNDKGDILYLHGRTGMFLEPAQGKVMSQNIFKMAREGLKQKIKPGFLEITKNRKTVRINDLRVKTNGNFSSVDLTIHLVNKYNNKPIQNQLFVVLLSINEKETPLDTTTQEVQDIPIDVDEQMKELRLELQLKEEFLQTTIEDLETSNQELESSNEELQSLNEEMQSTHEEMETSREELQSINEELSTVNAELQSKIEELIHINNDMNNLLSGTNIATIFLDMKQNILRFTPTAKSIVNLLPSDQGRPISDIVSNFKKYNRLNEDVKKVLDTLIPITLDLQLNNDQWYQMIIQPYRTISNVIEGAVVTFVNITDKKIAKQKLAISETKYHVLFNTTKDGILILDGITGSIINVNPYLINLLGYPIASILNKKIWEIGFLKDIISNKDLFVKLQEKEHSIYENLVLETSENKKINVEFISNVFTVNNHKQIQCNIRKIIR